MGDVWFEQVFEYVLRDNKIERLVSERLALQVLAPDAIADVS
jgi:hypothetical protein